MAKRRRNGATGYTRVELRDSQNFWPTGGAPKMSVSMGPRFPNPKPGVRAVGVHAYSRRRPLKGPRGIARKFLSPRELARLRRTNPPRFHPQSPLYTEPRKVRGRKWNIHPTAAQEPKLLKRALPGWTQAEHLRERDEHLKERERAIGIQMKAQRAAEKRFGTQGAYLSGGVRESWPRHIKDRVGGLARRAGASESAAYAHHSASGTRKSFTAARADAYIGRKRNGAVRLPLTPYVSKNPTHAGHLKTIREAAARVGLHVAAWSPGDGQTRYRFFVNPGNDYFGPENGIKTVLGKKNALAFIEAYGHGKPRGNPGAFGKRRAKNFATGLAASLTKKGLKKAKAWAIIAYDKHGKKLMKETFRSAAHAAEEKAKKLVGKKIRGHRIYKAVLES